MYANVHQDRHYKLMELTPQLLKLIEENNEPLTVKASGNDSEIVMCTKDQTFAIRQRNHSNTVMIMTANKEEEHLCGYTTMHSVYEVHKASGSIDITDIPIYDGADSLKGLKSTITLEKLKNDSAISEKEFDAVWFSLNGSAYNYTAIILSDDFITRTLHVMLMSIMAAKLNIDELSLIEVYQSMEEDPEFTIDIIETVLRKFVKGEREPFVMNKTKIAQWYGNEALRKHASKKPLTVSDFLFKWKSELPPFFDCPIDLPLLYGHFCAPLPDRVQFVSRSSLPSDVNNRLKVLFKLQSTWELDQLMPFVEEFNVKGVKPENFIMKFAKKKKVGKKIMITPR